MAATLTRSRPVALAFDMRTRPLSIPALVRPYLILSFFALSAVGWRSIGVSGAGTLRYFHIPLFAMMILATGRLALLRRIEPLAIAISIYTLVYVTFSWYHLAPPLALQQGAYFIGGFMVAASLRNATERDWRILKWTGPASLVLFLVAFFADAAAVGINVLGSFQVAIASGNLNLIQFGIFQPIFNAQYGGAIINSAALRGQVVAGIVVSVYLSMYARTQVRSRSRLFEIVHFGTIMLGGLIIMLTLARFLILAVAVGPLIVAGRALVRSKARPVVLLLTSLSGLVVVLAFVSPVASLVYERFAGDTGSYDERGSSFTFALDAIFNSPLLGSNTGGDTAALISGDRSTLSAHNFVLDATVNGGLLTGVLAFVVLAWIFRDAARGVIRYLHDETFFAPMAAIVLTPIVMFSAGSGTLGMTDILGLALFYGARERAIDREIDNRTTELAATVDAEYDATERSSRPS